MPLLLKPYLGCNLHCDYCYEQNLREIEKPGMNYDLDSIFKAMEEHKELDMTLHGGEPLCMPKKDVEAILTKSFELKGKSGIQTNGTLIDDDFIRMFKKYKTSVGISMDGPGELTKYRMDMEQTKKIERIIIRLVNEGVPTSIIAIISKSNAGDDEKLERFEAWLLQLNKHKISGRLNPCSNMPECELPMERLLEVYLKLARFCLENNLRWSPFRDIIKRSQGRSAVCVFMGCDPFHTPSATVVLGNGSITNCMRRNQTGILLQHPAKYDTRDEILQETPQEYGGCQGCEFFSSCHGACPSQAINGDWRNRSSLCPLWKALFSYYRNVLSFCGIENTKKQVSHRIPVPGKPGYFHGDSAHGDSDVDNHKHSHGDHSDHGDS